MSIGWIQALTERQPQSEKKAARARPMSAKAVVVLCATSFFVGLLLSGRMTLLMPPPSGSVGAASSGHGSRLSLFSDDCENRHVSISIHAHFDQNLYRTA